MTLSIECADCHNRATLDTEEWLYKCFVCEKDYPIPAVKMKKERLLRVLKNISEQANIEEGHILADLALLNFINDPEIAAAFSAVRRCYS